MLKIIDTIAKIPSKNGKIDHLRSSLADPLFCNLVQLTYDPSVSFYTRGVKDKSRRIGEHNTLTYALEILRNKIATRTVTGAEASDVINNTYASLAPDDQEVMSRVLSRNLKAGFNKSSINQAAGKDLIPVFGYMRCSLASEKTLKKIKYPAYSQVKADGMYANVQYSDAKGSVSIFTRQGNKVEGLPDNLLRDIHEVCLSADLTIDPVLNGELLAYDQNGDLLPRQKGNGLFGSLLKGGEWPKEYTAKLVVWDVVDGKYYQSGESVLSYKDRYQELETMLKIAKVDSVSLIETKVVVNYDEAMSHFRECLARGQEGVVLKDWRGKWKNGTSIYQLKMKLVMEVDLECVGFNKGSPTGKHADTFGSIQFESADGKFVVGCSGMSDKERQYIWDNSDDYLGRIAAVTINGTMPANDKGIASGFLPRLSEWREDKDEADTYARILEIERNSLGGK